MVNYELPVASLLLASADWLLLAAGCLLRLRGSSSWRDSWPTQQPATECLLLREWGNS